ncbi:hypothetical protein TNCV_4246771 [Trichonephila clavipes]|nr:hypothetical protein TNCV_4246771 [Trichonephila clavipes]
MNDLIYYIRSRYSFVNFSKLCLKTKTANFPCIHDFPVILQRATTEVAKENPKRIMSNETRWRPEYQRLNLSLLSRRETRRKTKIFALIGKTGIRARDFGLMIRKTNNWKDFLRHPDLLQTSQSP